MRNVPLVLRDNYAVTLRLRLIGWMKIRQLTICAGKVTLTHARKYVTSCSACIANTKSCSASTVCWPVICWIDNFFPNWVCRSSGPRCTNFTGDKGTRDPLRMCSISTSLSQLKKSTRVPQMLHICITALTNFCSPTTLQRSQIT